MSCKVSMSLGLAVLLVGGTPAARSAPARSDAQERVGPVDWATSPVMEDAWVTVQVLTGLYEHLRFAGRSLHVDTVRGVVTLRGIVESREARALAAEITWRVEGVKEVRNDLVVAAPSERAHGSEYRYPYHDPYLATVTTAILNADGVNPGLTRQVVHVPVLRRRNRLPTLEGRGVLSVALYRQAHAAPLMFILAGIGSSPYFGFATYFARLFHQRGFHVVILPSPMTWNFALAASRTGVPGNVPDDAQDLYVAMQKTLEVLRHRHRVQITDIDFIGVSLGALEGAYLSVLDRKERRIEIQRYLLANPPSDLTYALTKLDEMAALRNALGPARSKAVMIKALAIVEPFTHERRYDSTVFDKLLKEFSGFSSEEIQFLIAEYLQSVLPELVYVTEVLRGPQISVPSMMEARRRIHDARQITYMEYSERIGVPAWRTAAGEPRADLRTFTERGSLAPILEQLRDNPRVYILHNADDFLVEPGSLRKLAAAS